MNEFPKEYRVVWQQCPHVHHDRHVLFVKAASADDAKTLARDHVERTVGVEWFSVHSAEEVKPMPEGGVVKEAAR